MNSPHPRATRTPLSRMLPGYKRMRRKLYASSWEVHLYCW